MTVGDKTQGIVLQSLRYGDTSLIVKVYTRDSVKVYGTDKTVTYDPQKRIGVMISKIGASKAISVGAYDFALAQLDA